MWADGPKNDLGGNRRKKKKASFQGMDGRNREKHFPPGLLLLPMHAACFLCVHLSSPLLSLSRKRKDCHRTLSEFYRGGNPKFGQRRRKEEKLFSCTKAAAVRSSSSSFWQLLHFTRLRSPLVRLFQRIAFTLILAHIFTLSPSSGHCRCRWLKRPRKEEKGRERMGRSKTRRGGIVAERGGGRGDFHGLACFSPRRRKWRKKHSTLSWPFRKRFKKKKQSNGENDSRQLF